MSDGPAVVFRCDANARIGFGHLRRCLALAGALQTRGRSCRFVSRLEDCSTAPFPCVTPPPCWEDDREFLLAQSRAAGADLLILDHYGVNEAYQHWLFRQGLRWLQFISLPLRDKIWADWVVTASPAAEASAFQPLLQKPETRLLLGPSYAVLRDEFIATRAHQRDTDPLMCCVAVSFGGGHDRGALQLCLDAMAGWREDIKMRFLTTSANPNAIALAAAHRECGHRIKVLVDAPDFAEQLATADLAVIGGGMTAFEVACLGLPAVIVQVADDQATNAATWDRLGSAINLGRLESVTVDRLRTCLDQLCGDITLRDAMSVAGRHLVDGQGAQRVAAALTA